MVRENIREIVEKPEPLRSVPRYFKRYGISIDDFIERLGNLFPCDFIFITSLMSYWYLGVQKAIEIVRAISPHTPIILGGIYATLYHEHASKLSGADFVYKGHMSGNIKSVIESFRFRLKENYLPKPYYKLNIYQHHPFAPILTSKGCPYRCSYCASKILSDEYLQRDPSEVFNEIKELFAIGIRDFAFYDDALLVNADLHIKIIKDNYKRSN